MKCALLIFPYYVRTGGWIALAGMQVSPLPLKINENNGTFLTGTHFHFIREIPILAFYEVRSQIVGWDHKWVRHTLSKSRFQHDRCFCSSALYRPSLCLTSQACFAHAGTQKRTVVIVRRLCSEWQPSKSKSKSLFKFCIGASHPGNPYALDATHKRDAFTFKRKPTSYARPLQRCRHWH